MLKADWAVKRGRTHAGKLALYEEVEVWTAPTDQRTYAERLHDAAQVYSLLKSTGSADTFKP